MLQLAGSAESGEFYFAAAGFYALRVVSMLWYSLVQTPSSIVCRRAKVLAVSHPPYSKMFLHLEIDAARNGKMLEPQIKSYFLFSNLSYLSFAQSSAD